MITDNKEQTHIDISEITSINNNRVTKESKADKQLITHSPSLNTATHKSVVKIKIEQLEESAEQNLPEMTSKMEVAMPNHSPGLGDGNKENAKGFITTEQQTPNKEGAGEDLDEDKFDLGSEPLTRSDMVKNYNHATKETLDFVYKTSTRISPPGPTESLTPGVHNNYSSTGSNRITHRRGSGVPPPPRELKQSDYLFRRAANVNMVEGSEEEEEEN